MNTNDFDQTAEETARAVLNRGPCLPGFERLDEQADGEPPPEIRIRTHADGGAAMRMLRKLAADDRFLRRMAVAAVAAVAAVCTGVAIVLTDSLIRPRTVVKEVTKETPSEPADIPLDLLPDAADPAIWDIVSNLSGSIEGIDLRFRQGLAHAKGLTFKVCLDFCQSNGHVYVRVSAGATNWVVQADPNGRIIKSYRVPRTNRKPLKDILSR